MVNRDENKAPRLIDVVFSWSIADVMNKNLYKDKVEKIPDTFPSACNYLKSFVNPLVEETHADLRSSMTTLDSSPTREIFEIKRTEKHNRPSRTFVYEIALKKVAVGQKKPTIYEPEVGDLIALMDVVPKCIGDLFRLKKSYTVALVHTLKGVGSVKIPILCSKPISFQKEGKLLAVYLTNLTTNIRIWSALHPGQGENMKVINSVLSCTPAMEENCTQCSSSNTHSINLAEQIKGFNSLGLNDSQKAAVSNCIAVTKCHHRNNVKLIWGPPGTGKTKTIASLAFTLLNMQHRTLICAPTNVAITGVTKILMKYLSGELEHGLGDIVLFGNGERLRIDEHEDLHDVFLHHRIDVLAQCMHPLKGWSGCLDEMIWLLQNPVRQYTRYLNRQREKLNDDSNSDQSDDNDDDGGISEDETCKGTLKGNIWKKTIIQNIKANKKKKLMETEPHEGNDSNENKHVHSGNKASVLWSFEEFFTKKFSSIGRQLIFCINGLYTHLPSCWLPMEVLPRLIRALHMLQVLGTHLDSIDITDKVHLRRALIGRNEMGNLNGTASLCRIRLECLKILKMLRKTFVVPAFIHYGDIKDFCLENACLVFCTVSSSAKLHWNRTLPFEMVIVDEAAQLKECESCIPLQLPGLHHAVLVGDEKQLPAMVESKICEKAGFGRSLFERLATLGHSKHLLNVQYRMHPRICLFPNEEFYAKQIKNGPNVMEKGYDKHFLRGRGGDLYGPYSFINVTSGKEGTDNRRSRKNILEVYVVSEIVAKLYRESVKSKIRIRVGCISPYSAQVFAIQEAFGKTYSTDANDAFSVSVRSIDGFQGGEEDIIIISTVRCNGNGSIGFLDNPRRTNVALTRARHCLWILGNAPTLLKSNSIWQKLVANAKNRGCFYNAYDDDDLSVAISSALIELDQMDSVFSTDSVLFKAATWKVFFSGKFHRSIARIQDTAIHKQVASLVTKIANGWRQRYNAKTVSQTERPSSLLLEWCDVKQQQLKLIWTVNILREKNSTDTQVIEILDLLPRHEFPQVAKEFDRRNYSVSHLNRCLCKRLYRGVILPVSWPVDSGKSSSYSTSDPSWGDDIASQLAAMSLRDDHEPRRNGNRHWRNHHWGRKRNNYN